MSLFRIPIVTLALAWAIPGSGHFILGQRWRGIAFFLAITHTFIAGLALTDGLCVSRQEHPIAFIAQAPAGAPVLAAKWFEKRRQGASRGEVVLTDALVARLDLGLLYTMVAGLLNFLLAIDAFERAIKRGQEDERAAHQAGLGGSAS